MNYKNLFIIFFLIVKTAQNFNAANSVAKSIERPNIQIIKDATLVDETEKYIKFLDQYYQTHKPLIALQNKLLKMSYKTGAPLTIAITHTRANLDSIATLSTEIIAAQNRSMPKGSINDTRFLHEKFLKLLSNCYESLFHPFMLAPAIDSFYPEYKLQLLTIAINPKNKDKSLQQIAEILHRMDEAWHLYSDLLYNGAEHIQVKLHWSDYKMSIDDWRSLTRSNATDLQNLPIVRKLTAMELWLLRSWHKAQRYALSFVI